jgi:hypothetical protein
MAGQEAREGKGRETMRERGVGDRHLHMALQRCRCVLQFVQVADLAAQRMANLVNRLGSAAAQQEAQPALALVS